MRRYGGGIDYVLKMPLEEGVFFISTVLEKEQEEQVWQMWLAFNPLMEQPVPFNQYLDQLKKEAMRSQKSKESPDQIIKLAERIKQADQATRR